jgi:hypothetical protein
MNESTLTLSPLDKTYAALARPMPQIEFIDAQSIPQPYKTLLVHKDDMTPTLEQFHQQTLELRVLEQKPTEHILLRQVLLISHNVDQPVEFGAIKIQLDHFTPDAQSKILSGTVPLGTIFCEQNIQHTSNPQAYFKIWPDQTITDALNIDQPQWLFGRQNIHRDLNKNTLAEMVEILPPHKENLQ